MLCHQFNLTTILCFMLNKFLRYSKQSNPKISTIDTQCCPTVLDRTRRILSIPSDSKTYFQILCSTDFISSATPPSFIKVHNPLNLSHVQPFETIAYPRHRHRSSDWIQPAGDVGSDWNGDGELEPRHQTVSVVGMRIQVPQCRPSTTPAPIGHHPCIDGQRRQSFQFDFLPFDGHYGMVDQTGKKLIRT